MTTKVNSSAEGQNLRKRDQELLLLKAVKCGKFQKVIRLIETAQNKNPSDASGFSALHHAAQNGQYEILQYLCQISIPVQEMAKHPFILQAKMDILKL